MKTQIQRQDECIARMLSTRTSPKRAAKNAASAITLYRRQCVKLGYTDQDIRDMVRDIRDMVALEMLADQWGADK